jgi:hypothetical protein
MKYFQDPYTLQIHSTDGRNISGIEAYENMSEQRSRLQALSILASQVQPDWGDGTEIDEHGIMRNQQYGKWKRSNKV